MIDQRERFERAFELFEMPEPALVRLLGRRDRKQRNRRIAAGAVAITLVALVIGGWLGAITLDRSTPADGTVVPTVRDPFVGVWTSVSDDGSARLLEIRDPSLDRANYQIHFYQDEAPACGGGVATSDGVGELGSDGRMNVAPRVLTCGDGTTVDLGAETLVHDQATGTLVEADGARWTRALAHQRDPDPQPSRDADAGLWPQATVAEAEAAQRLAEAGDPAYKWQLERESGSHVDGQQVVRAFVEDQLGLAPYHFDEVGVPRRGAFGTVITWTFVLCAQGQHNEDYANVACAPLDGNRFSAVDVTVEQLAGYGWNGGDVDGIWVVTGWGASEFRQSTPPSEEEVRQLLEGFLEARLAGQGAEAYLGASAEAFRYFGPLNLYATTGGSPFVDYEIVVDVSEPTWPSGTIYPDVRLFAADGTVVEETHYHVGRAEIESGTLTTDYAFDVKEIEP